MTSIVWAPGDLIIATSQGVDVRFAGVEISTDLPERRWPLPGERGIRVHLSGVRSGATAELDGAYGTALAAWEEQRTAQGHDGADRPPIMPGEVVLTPVQAVITDNRDTNYRRMAGRVAGSGTEWDAFWVFTPEPPAGLKHLTIEFTLHGELTGRSVRVQLES